MIDFFAMLYEWFGLSPFYAKDLAEHLHGFSLDCADYSGTPWYLIFGWVMIGSTILAYMLQYHFVDSPRLARKRHWWYFALGFAGLNFLIGFLTTLNTLNGGNFCDELIFGTADCLGFGLCNALWSLLLYILLTVTPLFRQFSVNCKFTTFYKP
jgi:hypothetical protein